MPFLVYKDKMWAKSLYSYYYILKMAYNNLERILRFSIYIQILQCFTEEGMYSGIKPMLNFAYETYIFTLVIIITCLETNACM